MTETTQGNVAYNASNALTLRTSAKEWLDDAEATKIDSPMMYEMAGSDLRKIKALASDVETERTKITKPMNDALKAVNDLFRPAKEFLERAEVILKDRMLSWSEAQERIAAQERKRVAALEEAERKRIEEEQIRLLREAADAQAEGDSEMAAKLAEEADAKSIEASVISMPMEVAPARSVQGISTRVTWSAEVTDLKVLLQAVIDGKAPPECICADQKFLDQQAKAYKRPALYPGVRGKQTSGITARK